MKIHRVTMITSTREPWGGRWGDLGTPCPGQRPTGSSAHFGVLEGTLPDQGSSLSQQAIETRIYDRP